jgi:hypothetical protein
MSVVVGMKAPRQFTQTVYDMLRPALRGRELQNTRRILTDALGGGGSPRLELDRVDVDGPAYAPSFRPFAHGGQHRVDERVQRRASGILQQ